MAALKVKGRDGDDDADSASGAVSDITGTGIATHSDDGGSIFTSGLGTYISDEFQVSILQVIIPPNIKTLFGSIFIYIRFLLILISMVTAYLYLVSMYFLIAVTCKQ